jgi:hypothetical protein
MLLPFGRLLLLISFCTSLISAYFVILFLKSKIKLHLLYILIIVTIGYTFLNWGHRNVLTNIDDNFLIQNVPYSTVNEGTTAYFLNNRWADINNFWFDKIPTKHLEIINGVGSVTEISRTSVTHTYEINATSPLIITEYTLYFPGWKFKIGNREISVYPGERGVISSNLPKGKYKIELVYQDIFIYSLSKFISMFFFFIFIILMLIYFFRSRRLRTNP